MQNLLSQEATALQFLMNEELYHIDEVNIAETQIPVPQNLLEEPAVKTLEKEKYSDFSYLGDNNKYFLILVDDKTHKDLNALHREMLLKVMQAKGMELRDLAILNLDRYPGVKFTELKAFFGCNRLALFGISPARISLPSIGANMAEKIDNVKIMATFSLAEMEDDKNKKREFWNVMKAF